MNDERAKEFFDTLDEKLNRADIAFSFVKKPDVDVYDSCYYGGEYDDQYCGGCPYKDNCSGYDDEDLE